MNNLLQHSLPALGFGTSRLGHHQSKEEALATLQVAYENGIRYIDTAPIYSYGWSERLVGAFQEGKRDKLVITTKMGLQPSPILSALPFGLLRRVRQLAKKLKGNSTQGLPPGVSQHTSKRFDTKNAISNLHTSLRRLKTDYVDVLLLHESTVDEANDPEALEFMEQVISTGMVRAVGIGSTFAKLCHLDQLDPIYTVVQHEYNLLNPPTVSSEKRAVNTHGLFQQMKRIQSLSSIVSFKREWEKSFNLDFSIDADTLNFCLSGARYQYPDGVTLFSSTSRQHIRDTIQAWENPTLSATQFQQVITIIRKHIATI